MHNTKFLLHAAEQYGTPLYYYDADIIRHQYKRLVNSFTDITIKPKYACKANTNIHILKLLKAEGCGLDTVSIQEVELGLFAGFQQDEILYTPNCVDIAEISKAVEFGVHINIDALPILEQFGSKYGNSVPICVRINPHVLAGGNSHIQTGHIDSKFGISIHQIRHLLRIIQLYDIQVAGLHMHTGSDIVDPQSFIYGLDILLDVAKDFKDLKYIDFGSGFKVPYKPGDVESPIEEIGRQVSIRFKEFCTEYGKDLELWCEPGKYLVSQAGVFLVNVNVVKQTVSTVFAGVNSGLNHLIRPMMYEAYHRIENISNVTEIERVYSVVGNICETDTFGWDRKISEIREGDVLAMYNAGAYGFSMSSQYNSRLRPAEVLKDGTELKLIRRREEINDLIYTQMLDK